MIEPGTSKGLTALVTGATSGIGLATSTMLADRGLHVILVGRDPARTEAALAHVRAATGSAHLTGLNADLTSFASIRALAATVRRDHGSLDVLVNNAGGVFQDRRITEDGVEASYALNHLAPFLLTHLLVPALRAAPRGRVINVNGAMHFLGKIDLADLRGERAHRPLGAYAAAKLANLMFTYALARRLGPTVQVNAFHPGSVRTAHADKTRGFLRLFSLVQRPFMSTPEQGADTGVYLATDPDVEAVTGKYFVKRKPVASSATSRDQALGERVWDASAEITGVGAAR